MAKYYTNYRSVIIAGMIIAWLTVVLLMASCNNLVPNPAKSNQNVYRGEENKELYLHKEDVEELKQYLTQREKINTEIMGFLGALILFLLGMQVRTNTTLAGDVKKLSIALATSEQAERDMKKTCDNNHINLDDTLKDFEGRLRVLEHQKT